MLNDPRFAVGGVLPRSSLHTIFMTNTFAGLPS